MKQSERDSKLERGLRAYADAAKAGGTLTSFRKRLGSWPVYAAAAGSALALSTSAMADIITGTEGTFPPGNIGFSGYRQFEGGFSSVAIFLRGTGAAIAGAGFAGNRFSADIEAFHNSQVVAFGPLGTNTVFSDTGLLRSGFFCQPSRCGSTVRGSGGAWPANGTAFAAFELSNGDVGWLEIAMRSNQHGVPDDVTILGWAYNDVPGQPIHIGTVPEPSTLALALLATGSAGVLAWRRRRKAAAQEASVSTGKR